MQSHPVPQNIMQVEFQLVGFLTLRQFGYLAAAGILAWLVIITPLLFFIKAIIAAILVILGLALAFLPINDMRFEKWLIAFFKAVYSPTRRVWLKEAKTVDFLTNKLDAIIARPLAAPTTRVSNRARLDLFLSTRQAQSKNSLDNLEDRRLSSLDFGAEAPAELIAIPDLAPSSLPQPTTRPEEARIVEEEPAVVNKIASKVIFTPVATIKLPDKNIFVKPVGSKRSHFLNPKTALEGTIHLPIRGERLFQVSQDLTQRLNKYVQPLTDKKIASEVLPAENTQPIPIHQFTAPNQAPTVNVFLNSQPNQASNQGSSTVTTGNVTNVSIPTNPPSQANQSSSQPPSSTVHTYVAPSANQEYPTTTNQGYSQPPSESASTPPPSTQGFTALTTNQPTTNPPFNQITTPVPSGNVTMSTPPSGNIPTTPEIQTNQNYTTPATSQVSTSTPTQAGQSYSQPVSRPASATAPSTPPANQKYTQPSGDIPLPTSTPSVSQDLPDLPRVVSDSPPLTAYEEPTFPTAKPESSQKEMAENIERLNSEESRLQGELEKYQNQEKLLQEQLRLNREKPVSNEQTEKLKEVEEQLKTMQQEKEHALSRAEKLESLIGQLRTSSPRPAQNREVIIPSLGQVAKAPSIQVISPRRAEGKMAPPTTTVPNVINGVVKDAHGLLLPETIIVVKDKNEEPVRALKTNKVGQFAISTALPNGTYIMEIEKEGYEFDYIEIQLEGEILPPIEIRSRNGVGGAI